MKKNNLIQTHNPSKPNLLHKNNAKHQNLQEPIKNNRLNTERDSQFSLLKTNNNQMISIQLKNNLPTLFIDKSIWFLSIFETQEERQCIRKNKKAYEDYYKKEIAEYDDLKNSKQPRLIYQPKPHHSTYCQVCDEYFSDYKHHIYSSSHLIKKQIKGNSKNQPKYMFISNLLQLVQDLPTAKDNISLTKNDRIHTNLAQKQEYQIIEQLKSSMKAWKHLTGLVKNLSTKI